jgi:hypothetical protein
VVPSLWSVAAAHAAVEHLEHHILATLGAKGAVMIHLDHPHQDAASAAEIDLGKDAELTAKEIAPFSVAQATRFKLG